MGIGTNKNRCLLTIAIPTWNRASTLDEALGHLLPQVVKFNNEVEVIISDNASDDNTREIVNNNILKYPLANIAYNRNDVNTQFFGNYNKCRELANGRYIWILSDDDFVCDNVISEVLDNLIMNDGIVLVHFKNSNKYKSLQTLILDKEELLIRESYRLSLISSVIYLNNKNDDSLINDRYKNSSFIGFIYPLNAFKYGKEVMLIQGKCFNGSMSRQKLKNWFDVYINSMEHVIDYMEQIGLPTAVINHFRKRYLLEFILPNYVIFKANGELGFGDYEAMSIYEIELWIKNNYSDLWEFWIQFYPLYFVPSAVFRIGLGFRQLVRKKVKPNFISFN